MHYTSSSSNSYYYNYQTGQYQNIDAVQIGSILQVAGPLIVKYLVPFFKELISSKKLVSQRLTWHHLW